jgi:hypothetical protein
MAHMNGSVHRMDGELPPLPLEEIGLYLLLERIHRGTATARDFARITLIQPGLVDGGTMTLSEPGKDKLQALRATLAASNDGPVSTTATRGQS